MINKNKIKMKLQIKILMNKKMKRKITKLLKNKYKAIQFKNKRMTKKQVII